MIPPLGPDIRGELVRGRPESETAFQNSQLGALSVSERGQSWCEPPGDGPQLGGGQGSREPFLFRFPIPH